MLSLAERLIARYADPPSIPPELNDLADLTRIAGRGSCRAFDPRPVSMPLLQTLAAVALAAPSKSDLQQRDIILVEDPLICDQIKALLRDQTWIEAAPRIVLFCGNNRRQRLLHQWWNRVFANDHLDPFFNASVDAGIALMAFITAAEAAGLGCCPISTIRNQSEAVSELLGLPEHVFPVAALAVGYPVYPAPRITPRLPLGVTVHVDRYSETGLRDAVAGYDATRAGPKTQRSPDIFGLAETYTWSDDKTRQYAVPERADFGAFVRSKGFRLD